jgi:hypothetical protein
VPLDGGDYVLEARAPGRRPWRETVRVASAGDRKVVVVPELTAEPLPAPAAVAVKSPLPPAEPREPREPRGLANLQWAGVGTGSAGVVALGVGGYFAARALSSKSDSQRLGCDGSACSTDAGEAALDDAGRFGDYATGFAIAGGSLVALGGTLFLVGRRAPEERRSLSLSVGPSSFGARLSGAF